MQTIFKTCLLLFLIFSTKPCTSQTITNGDFETVDTTLKVLGWKWSNAFGYKFVADPFTHYSGNYSALLENVSNIATESGGAAFVQPFLTQKTGLKSWRFSVMVKTQSAAPCGVILNAFCRQFPILSTDMFERGIGGTADWRKIVAEFTLPTYTNALSFGGMLTGSGKIWFDDFKLEEIPLDIKPVSPLVKKYFAEFIDTLKLNSIRRDSVDFDLLEKDLELMANGAQNKDDLKLPFQYAFAAMNDNFGAFYDSTTMVKAEADKIIALKNKKAAPPLRYAVGGLWKNEYAIIRIPSFFVEDPILSKLYSDSLVHLIKKIENKHPKGFLIDLRDCSTGNVDALMNGFSPFFNDKKTLNLNYANGKMKSWDYSDTTKYKLNKKMSVAVLTGPLTQTAAEAVVIAFKSKKNTKQFGEPTGGSNEEARNFKLSDGASVSFSTGVYSDAKNKKYFDRIKPDQFVEFPKNVQIKIEEDAVVYLATQWIEKF